MSELNAANQSELKDTTSQTKCPLQLIPASAWQEFMKKLCPKPFRKRHPFIFWPIVLMIIIGLCASFFANSHDSGIDVNEDSLAIIKNSLITTCYGFAIFNILNTLLKSAFQITRKHFSIDALVIE